MNVSIEDVKKVFLKHVTGVEVKSLAMSAGGVRYTHNTSESDKQFIIVLDDYQKTKKELLIVFCHEILHVYLHIEENQNGRHEGLEEDIRQTATLLVLQFSHEIEDLLLKFLPKTEIEKIIA